MKRILLIAVAAAISNASFAQYVKKQPVNKKEEEAKKMPSSGFYFRLGAGYAFPNAGQTLGTDGAPLSGTAGSSNGSGFDTYDLKKVSFSSGGQVHVDAGYMFTRNLGVELGANFGVAAKEYKTTITFPSADRTRTYRQEIKQSVKNSILLLPSVVLQSGGRKLNVYAKGSVVLPLRVKPTSDIVQTSNLIGTNDVSTIAVSYNTKTKFHPGFGGALGLSYKVSPYISIWAEANLVSFSAYVKEDVMTSYQQDGVSYSVSNVPSIKYGTKTGGSNTDATYSLPMSNIGINAGVALAF